MVYIQKHIIDFQTKDVVGGNPSNKLHPFYSLSSGKVIAANKNGKYHLISITIKKKILVLYIYMHIQ